MEQLEALYDLATSYHGCRDTASLLKMLASKLGERLEARGVLVWLWDPSKERLVRRARWFERGVRFDPAPQPDGGRLLSGMLETSRARRISAQESTPALFEHLAENDRERVKNALYARLPGPHGSAGVIEVLNKKSGEFTAEEAVFVEEASRLTGAALETHQELEREHHSQLGTIERLTALYDISRIFNSTLELEHLLPVVAEKIQDILGARACNIWLVDAQAQEVYFSQQAGEDPTTQEGTRAPLGEGLVGEVAKQGEARLVADASEEPLLEARREEAEEFEIESVMCVPLLKEEQVLAVVEVVNKRDGTPFDEDDLFFLTSLGEQAAIALNNANLLEAERKVHELDALLAISKEITSTLNLDHVLTTVVHQAATVVPFERCVIGLFDRNRFVLGAVSGETTVPQNREMDELRSLLEWVAEQPGAVRADASEEGWQVSPEEGRARLVSYLETHEVHGFYALPLQDDQGTVGVLALLSREAEFLSENHLEVLSILANQTTVAIRNARLYQEVPLMSLWQPLVERKQKLQAIPYGRWLEIGWRVGLVALLLVVIPWKMRFGVNATVVPADRRVVSAETEGIVESVLVHEGDQVARGAVLAQIDDGDNRVRLEQAEADLALARRRLAEADAGRDLAGVSQARLRLEQHEAEVALYRYKVEKAKLLAPIDGVVVTPKVEEKVGQRLRVGDTFCEVVEQDRLAVEMNVPEGDVDLIEPGVGVAIKLNTFPTHTLRGKVERVSAKTITAEEKQFFVVRAVFPNPEKKVRPGMVGRAKITAVGGWFESGWYPVGYVFLRAPARWVWRKAWAWLP